MEEMRKFINKGGLFHFNIKGSDNILKEFMAFKKGLSKHQPIKFQYVEDKVHFENNFTVQEYIFREFTNDFTHFDIEKCLNMRNSPHLNESLFSKTEMYKSIRQLDHQNAKFYALLKTFLTPSKHIIFINLQTINFSSTLSTLLARVLQWEIKFKNRIVFVYGKMPGAWSKLQRGQISIGQKRKFILDIPKVTKITKERPLTQSQKQKQSA